MKFTEKHLALSLIWLLGMYLMIFGNGPRPDGEITGLVFILVASLLWPLGNGKPRA